LLVVGSMVGTGVFTTTGLLVRDLGSPLAVLAAWAVGGALALCGALSYAELGAALPRNGGEYQLLGRIYHPALGFAAGIVSLLVGFAAPLAASALAFGHYLAAMVPAVSPTAAALALIAVAAAFHATSVASGARFQAATTAAQVALVLAFALAASLRGDASRLAAGGSGALAVVASPAFAVGLVLVSFAYSGWNAAAYVAGEMRAPARALPLALLAGTGAVTALYLGLNASFLAAAPAGELAGVVEVAHVAGGRLFGAAVGRALSGAVALVLVASVSAMLMSGARVYTAMGEDHPALAALARRTRGGGPAVAVAVQAALAAAMLLTSSFGALLAYIGFTLSAVAGLTVLGLVVLRIREPDLERPYRAWGYPATPFLFVSLSAWMIVHAIAENPTSSLAGLGTLGGGLALYAVLRRRSPAGATPPRGRGAAGP
jgi:APA family basic amino acid/polyamine antiporter